MFRSSSDGSAVSITHGGIDCIRALGTWNVSGVTCGGYRSVLRSRNGCCCGISFVCGVATCTGGAYGSVDMVEVVIIICCGKVVGVTGVSVLELEVVIDSCACCMCECCTVFWLGVVIGASGHGDCGGAVVWVW